MTTRRGAAGAASGAPGSPATRAAARPLAPDDERLNDDINALLREAAEQLELRTQAEAAQDTAAARRQFDAVVALARARARKPAADLTQRAARRTGH
jgi:ElaB/YqjD/DUF883 family membrane-anchored ribosome-binding protein